MKVKIGNGTLEIMMGDITQLSADAIVNAANAQLVLGGGVAGAIRRAGGPAIQEECDRIGGSFVGGAAITTGGNLKARHVIHAVGPRWGEGDERNKLRNAVANSLGLAEKHNLDSIAFPAISTGIFGFPKEPAAEIMLSAAVEHLKKSQKPGLVIFCLFGPGDYAVFEKALKKIVGAQG